jgi:hypothetical protein
MAHITRTDNDIVTADDPGMGSFVVRRGQPHDIYIGRPSKWGNPFVIGRDGTREEVIAKYRAWIVRQPDLMAALAELRGKVLGCYCAPLPCHGDVLADLANRRLDDQGVAVQRETRNSAG